MEYHQESRWHNGQRSRFRSEGWWVRIYLLTIILYRSSFLLSRKNISIEYLHYQIQLSIYCNSYNLNSAYQIAVLFNSAMTLLRRKKERKIVVCILRQHQSSLFTNFNPYLFMYSTKKLCNLLLYSTIQFYKSYYKHIINDQFFNSKNIPSRTTDSIRLIISFIKI